MTDSDKGMNPLHLGSDLADTQILINLDSYLGSLLVEAVKVEGVRYTWRWRRHVLSS